MGSRTVGLKAACTGCTVVAYIGPAWDCTDIGIVGDISLVVTEKSVVVLVACTLGYR